MAPIEVAATIGVFDGVHLGHQALIGRVVDSAHARVLRPVCITFSPHPEEVLRPEREIVHLLPLEDRIAAIKALGISEVLLLEFTLSLSRMSPEQFIDMLLERFQLRELWIGSDFALGKDRSGSPERLAAIGREIGFAVDSVPPVEVDGEVVSSSRIRRLLAEGDVEGAARLLGRPHRLRGGVVGGDRRGRTLGFPTANLAFAERLALPADGVYAARAGIDGDVVLPAVVSVGVRPTFQEGPRLVEVYLIDFDEELYGKQLAVDFVSRLRGQERFDSVDDLVKKMHEDVRISRDLLAIGRHRGGAESA